MLKLRDLPPQADEVWNCILLLFLRLVLRLVLVLVLVLVVLVVLVVVLVVVVVVSFCWCFFGYSCLVPFPNANCARWNLPT